MGGWDKSYFKSSELELNAQRKISKFAQTSPSLNGLILVVFKLFPHFPKSINQHFSVFRFSVWEKHCYTEIKHFPSSLKQAHAWLSVYMCSSAFSLHWRSY